MRLLYQFPTWLQRLYRGVVWRMDPSSKVVYLTFDDGPIPECTPQVLDILAQYGVKATFFMVGENVERNPELLARVRGEPSIRFCRDAISLKSKSSQRRSL